MTSGLHLALLFMEHASMMSRERLVAQHCAHLHSDDELTQSAKLNMVVFMGDWIT